MAAHKLRTLAVGVVVVAIASVGLVVATGGSRLAADSVTETRIDDRTATSLVLRWTRPPDDVDRWIVKAVVLPERTLLGSQVACGDCASMDWPYLTPGRTYEFTLAGVGGADGTVWSRVVGSTLADPLCAGVAGCVGIDATHEVGDVSDVGLGFLLGLTARTDRAFVEPLTPDYHRIDVLDESRFRAVRAAGGRINLMLQGAWYQYWERTLGVRTNPWEDWDAYRRVIRSAVRWHIDRGLMPDYWELTNEPDHADWFRSDAPDMGPTSERVLELLRITHEVVREELPDAVIVGPSVGAFDPDSSSVITLTQFLDFAVAEGLRIDVLSWHELGGGCFSACRDGGPRSIARHVETARALLAARPELGDPAIHINEFGAAATSWQPGHAAGYLAALAAVSEEVDHAASSCWPVPYGDRTFDSCYYEPGMLDGLMAPNATDPAAAWWVWEAYAALEGDRVASSVSLLDASVVAAQADDDDPLRVIIGRHAVCDQRLAVPCRDGVPTTDIPLTFRIQLDDDVERVRVEVRSIPALRGPPAPAPVVVLDEERDLDDGYLDLGPQPVVNGEAWLVVVTPLDD